MHICIDSNVFIRSIQVHDPINTRVLDLIAPDLTLSLPRLIAQEVQRNLWTAHQVRRFYRLFHYPDIARIIDEPVPPELVNKYVQMGLNDKGDAFIGAFAEWQGVAYLISNNRHFLRVLRPDAFTVLDAATFVAQWDAGRV
jgi:hypothetical protein